MLPVLLALTVCAVLAWGYFSFTSYPPIRHFLALHQGLETLSIVVSALIFAVGWRTRSFNPQRSVVILACGFLGVAMLEQPLPAKDDAALKNFIHPLPVCADESCHTRENLSALKGCYEMVNIKLDKTGGLTEALALAAEAQAQGFS